MASFTVQLQPPEGLGGLIHGEWGIYQQAEDGTFTVDSRDALNLLSLGMQVVPAPTPTGAVSRAQSTVSTVEHPLAAHEAKNAAHATETKSKSN